LIRTCITNLVYHGHFSLDVSIITEIMKICVSEWSTVLLASSKQYINRHDRLLIIWKYANEQPTTLATLREQYTDH